MCQEMKECFMSNNNVPHNPPAPPFESVPDSDPEKAAEELEKKGPSEDQQPSALEGELATLKDQWLRAMAETENLRRRATRDREEALKYASTNFGRDMLAIADNLRRALESCPATEDLPEPVKALIQGIEMTESALLSTFDRHGIKKIHPLSEKFDANSHQAMFEVEDESVPAGTVVQVLQTGYTLHDRLLRPAMVGVSKGVAKQESCADS
jgi:molecular chaperone GrpE